MYFRQREQDLDQQGCWAHAFINSMIFTNRCHKCSPNKGFSICVHVKVKWSVNWKSCRCGDSKMGRLYWLFSKKLLWWPKAAPKVRERKIQAFGQLLRTDWTQLWISVLTKHLILFLVFSTQSFSCLSREETTVSSTIRIPVTVFYIKSIIKMCTSCPFLAQIICD